MTLEEENIRLKEIIDEALKELKWNISSSHGFGVEEIIDLVNERLEDLYKNK